MKRSRDFGIKVMSQLCCTGLLCCAVFASRATAAEQPVMRSSQVNATTTPFNTIQTAYADPATVSSDLIQCHADLLGESLLFNSPLDIKLVGGFDIGFGSNPGTTKVNSLKVSSGSVRIRKVALVPAVCGNGVVESAELCDDGNKASADGCSATCTVESGFYCSGSPSVCLSVCGDGILAANEGCDDNNATNSDGCSSTCTVEPGYTCIGSPSVCFLTFPGVSGVTPSDAAINVVVPASIAVTFDSAMNNATLTAQSTAGACSGSIQVSTDDFTTCIGMQSPGLSQDASGHTVATLTPAPALSYGTAYKVRVTSGALNFIGNGCPQYTTPTGFFTATPGDQCSATGSVVISQVYGGGGNSGAVYRNDFVELHNNGTSPVSIAGWSVQYASAAGSTWQVTFLPAGATIPAGGYYLIQEASGAGGSTSLPAPDAFGSIPIAAGSGKVALVNNSTTLSGTCPTGAAIVDFVGYGITANCFEGTAPAPAPSNTTAVVRNDLGCRNGGKNSTDFVAAAPTPRNSATGANICSYTTNECGTALEVDYCNVQFPLSLNLSASGSSGAIYGQIYEGGVTEPFGAASGVIAQVGYGPADVNPENQSGWQWFNASYNTQAGNNDEYVGSFTAPAAGTYRYTYRFSLDGGSHWTYCDRNGAGSNAGMVFEVMQLPVLTVN